MSFLRRYSLENRQEVIEGSATPEEEARLQTEIAEDTAEINEIDAGIRQTEEARDALAETIAQADEVVRREDAGEEVAAETYQALGSAVRNAVRIVYGKHVNEVASTESFTSARDIVVAIERHYASLEEMAEAAEADVIEKKSNLLQKLGRGFIDLFRNTNKYKTEIQNVAADKYDPALANIAKNIKADIKEVAVNGNYKNVINVADLKNLIDLILNIHSTATKYMTNEGKKDDLNVLKIEEVSDLINNALKKYNGKPIAAAGGIAVVVKEEDGKYYTETEECSDATTLPSLPELNDMVTSVANSEKEVYRFDKVLSKAFTEYNKLIPVIHKFKKKAADELNDEAADQARHVMKSYDSLMNSTMELIQGIIRSFTKIERFSSDVVRAADKVKDETEESNEE